MTARTALRVLATITIWIAASVGCQRGEQPPGGADEGGGKNGPPEAAPGAAQHTTPDGVPFTAKFPGRPTWDTVPNLNLPAKGFVWPGDDKRRAHAAWVSVVPHEERDRKTDRELAIEYAQRATGMYHAVHAEQTPEGVWVAGWHTGRKKVEGNVTTWPQFRPTRGAGAAKVFVAGEKVYSLRVSGDNVEFDDPDFKAFCDSFRLDEVKNRPAAARAPDDDVRPIARVKGGSIAFMPSRAAVLVTRAESKEQAPGQWVNVGRIERYHYPSFRPAGVSEVSDTPLFTVPDDPRKRLYVVEAPTVVQLGLPSDAMKHRLGAYDVPDAGEGNKVAPLRPGKSLPFANRVVAVCVAPDGKSLYVLHRTVEQPHPNWRGGKTEAVRVEADGMTDTGQLPLDDGTWGLCLSPDRRALYAMADPGSGDRTPGRAANTLIQEIDPATWKLRRSFTARGNGGGTCGPDGCLYLTGSGCVTRVDPNAPGKPAVRLLDREDGDGSLLVSPNGKRLYFTPEDGPVYSADLKEWTAFNRCVISPESADTVWKRMQANSPIKLNAPGADKLSSSGVISPDGKCLMLTSGHVFWLTGAGAEPEADPAATWKP